MHAKQVSKPGRHGKLFLYRVTYDDYGMPGETRLYAYNLDHLYEKFHDDELWEGAQVVSVWPVYER